MGRTTPRKNVHTSPETAGAKNLKEASPGQLKPGNPNITSKIMPVWEHGRANDYKGLWTEDTLRESIDEFFQYCRTADLKPTQPLLRIWLNLSKVQWYEWLGNPLKYGFKANLITLAIEFMEAYLQENIDSYPTGSIFLLKTSHGHIESSKLDVTSNGKSMPNAEDINSLVAKLGLTKPK